MIVIWKNAVEVFTKTKESWQFGEVTVTAITLYGEQGKRVEALWVNDYYLLS